MTENTNWKEVERPARKADYRYKYLRLLAVPPEQRIVGCGKNLHAPLGRGDKACRIRQ